MSNDGGPAFPYSALAPDGETTYADKYPLVSVVEE